VLIAAAQTHVNIRITHSLSYSGAYCSMGFLTINCVMMIKAGFAADQQSIKQEILT
jgi:hypothetical protein